VRAALSSDGPPTYQPPRTAESPISVRFRRFGCARASCRPSRADAETAADERAYLETRFEVHADLVNAIAAADVDGTIRAVGRHKALLAGSS
jgi:hypothetical protein